MALSSHDISIRGFLDKHCFGNEVEYQLFDQDNQDTIKCINVKVDLNWLLDSYGGHKFYKDETGPDTTGFQSFSFSSKTHKLCVHEGSGCEEAWYEVEGDVRCFAPGMGWDGLISFLPVPRGSSCATVNHPVKGADMTLPIVSRYVLTFE